MIREWKLVVYGANANPENVSCNGGYADEKLTIDNANSGKMVPYGADGLTFYYTELDAQKDNFVLSATVTVDSWMMTNGEDDGFGLMVCDAIGSNGDRADFWNNSYMAAVTKVEYDWNPNSRTVSNVGDHIVMRQGIAAREKIGSAASHPEDAMEAAASQTVTTCTLESSQGAYGAGTYCIIGNATPVVSADGSEHAPVGTAQGAELLTSIKLEICRDNTGYRIRYTDKEGVIHEKLFYDTHRSNLSAIDSEKIYVGFFVSKQAHVTFNHMNLKVTNAGKDPKAEERTPELVDPDFKVTSSATANTENYKLVFQTNYAGVLTVKNELGTIASDIALEADESISLPCTLHLGDNQFVITFIPKAGESEAALLSNLSTAVFRHSVSYQRIGDEQGNIYTAPGSEGGNGTKESPTGLTEAVKYAAPGQTILLSEGMYTLSEPVNIERGHDGNEQAPIALISDPGNATRPVLNFDGRSAGIILSADYWYLYGFDCTGSAINEYGIHLTGNFNTLERLEVYRNGNTGIQVSSMSLWDDVSRWPSNNLILNCTSYGNCGDAYGDADGFACQATAGPGNVFDGCIAHHNADDGFDLYAKVWLQPVGPVTIRNCVAYQNGYLETGIEAGNGNGFKLGGDGMPGGHVVENCLSFKNKSHGFSSNSCPNVTIRNCTSIDNLGYNISLYTKNQKNTDYVVKNTYSLRTETAPETNDNVQGLGTQSESDWKNKTVYYWDPETKTAMNSEGVCITAQEVYASTVLEGSSIIRAQDGSIALQGTFLRRLAENGIGVNFGGN